MGGVLLGDLGIEEGWMGMGFVLGVRWLVMIDGLKGKEWKV